MLSRIVAMMGAREFVFNLTASDTNLRVAALNAGWNGSAKVTATNPGLALREFVVNGAFPGGVALVNNGFIAGGGGFRSTGGYGAGSGKDGNPGATGLTASVAVAVTNNGTIAGGGGGGGGGGGVVDSGGGQYSGGSGGLGATYPGSAESGFDGPQGPGGPGRGGNGGAPATAGQAGSQGFDSVGGVPTPGGTPGAAGNAVAGNSNITWLATGTRIGAVV